MVKATLTLEEKLKDRLPAKGNGCEYSESCFACFFNPDCIWDESKARVFVKVKRFKALKLAEDGMEPLQIAEELGMTLRTIKRYLTKKKQAVGVD